MENQNVSHFQMLFYTQSAKQSRKISSRFSTKTWQDSRIEINTQEKSVFLYSNK